MEDFAAEFRPAPLSAFPLFRRGRSQAGLMKGFCDFGAHPHPPRYARHLPPGEGLRAATWGRPYRGLRIGGTARPGGRALQKTPLQSGRVRTPAPTKYGNSVGADDLGGPRAARGRRPRRPAGGHMGPPLRFEQTALITGTVPLIRLACARHLPPGEGLLYRERCSAKPGAGVEPRQRQFLQTQGPVARKESRKVTQFSRAGRAPPTRRDHPPKRRAESSRPT